MAKEKTFVNPLKEGITYEEFLKAIPKETDVADYLKGNLEQEEIDWILEELVNYKNNNKQ